MKPNGLKNSAGGALPDNSSPMTGLRKKRNRAGGILGFNVGVLVVLVLTLWLEEWYYCGLAMFWYAAEHHCLHDHRVSGVVDLLRGERGGLAPLQQRLQEAW